METCAEVSSQSALHIPEGVELTEVYLFIHSLNVRWILGLEV